MLDHLDDLFVKDICIGISVPTFLFLTKITFKLPQGQMISRNVRQTNTCQFLEHKQWQEDGVIIWNLVTQVLKRKKKNNLSPKHSKLYALCKNVLQRSCHCTYQLLRNNSNMTSSKFPIIHFQLHDSSNNWVRHQ